MKNTRLAVLLLAQFLLANQLSAQDFLMQGWYWDYPKTSDGFNWADTLKNKAAELGEAGINHVWIPPHVKAATGNASNGYDPRDLYDLGEYGGPTGLGTRADYNTMITAFQNAGISAVGDMIYNHRDGGAPENNPFVRDWITKPAGYGDGSNGKLSWKYSINPYPSDRYRVLLPLGGSSGNGAGDFYFKISSLSGDGSFNGKEYRIYMQTSQKGWQGIDTELTETEPNGGGDCGQGFNDYTLGRNLRATLETTSGCNTDEFKVTLSAADFNATGDFLEIYLTNYNANYSDHRIYGIWSTARNQDIAGDLVYQTYTDFTNMPSGQGSMNYANFKPNGNNTDLGGDWDAMLFFYDYDQFSSDTQTKLFDWTVWNWENAGIRGLRMDAIKHFTPTFVGDLLDHMHDRGYNPGIVVGEWYGTDPGELGGWINNVKNAMDTDTKAAIKPRIFDFLLRDNLRQACDGFGFDVRSLYSNNLVANGVSAENVVTFANNHDFRNSSPGTSFDHLIKNDPKLAYAFLLTNNQLGIPTIFYPDYYGYPQNASKYPFHPNVGPMKEDINKLIKFHKEYVFGASNITYLNTEGSGYLSSSNYISAGDGASKATTAIFQLKGGAGGKDVVVAINFAGVTLKVDHQLNTASANGTVFTDYLTNSNFPYGVLNNGRIYIELPPRSYSVWVEDDLRPAIPVATAATSVGFYEFTANWNVSTKATHYTLEVSKDNFATIEKTYINIQGTSQLVNGLIPGTAYKYRVTAFNNLVTADSKSNEITATTNTKPFVEITAALSPFSANYSAAGGNQTYQLKGYNLEGNVEISTTGVFEISVDDGVTYSATATVGQADATAGKAIYLRLADYACESSNISENLTHKTQNGDDQQLPVGGAVSGGTSISTTISFTRISAPEVQINWTNPASNTTQDFDIMRADGSECATYKKLNTLPVSRINPNFTDNSVINGQTYYYKVRFHVP